ncbi:unnamed protein product [Heterobilharzia americana]|nr:unnamed protein product [Heterobilharzia americana]
MLEISCNNNGLSGIGYVPNGDYGHVNTYRVNYRDNHLKKLNNGDFTKYDGSINDFIAAQPTCQLRMPPQSQSTPECKVGDCYATNGEGSTSKVQTSAPFYNLSSGQNGLEDPTMTSDVTKTYFQCRSDTFENLDVQMPLLDYLVRHHAISGESSIKIIQADKHKRPFLLLRAIGLPIHNGSFASSKSGLASSHAPPPGLALLLNALRQTGHHELASYLDCSRRINPSSSLTSDGMSPGYSDLSGKRKRGQISLWVQLLAIKVCPALYSQLTEQNLHNTINTSMLLQDNNRTSDSSNEDKWQLKSSYRLPSSAVWIDHTICKPTPHIEQPNSDSLQSTGKVVKNVHSHWRKLLLPLICCFKGPKKVHESSLKNQSRNSMDCCTNPNLINDETQCNISSQRNSFRESTENPVVSCTNDFRTRTASRAILDSKSLQFYNSVLENDSPLHDAVVKYLEQSSGVLVLDCKLGHFSRKPTNTDASIESVSALCILLVATQSEIIKRLSENCNLHPSIIEPLSNETDKPLQSCELKTVSDKRMLTSKLADDLATVLIRAGALHRLELQNLRLLVTLDPKEVQVAIKELLDLEE